MNQLTTLAMRLALFVLLGLIAGGCAQQPVVPEPGAAPTRGQFDSRPQPQQRFDCSGLVYFSHRQLGIEVPRTTRGQRRHSRAVSLQALRPGDLVFFDLTDAKTRHVGIYIGDGRFIHAPSSGKRVSVASLDNPYWRRRLAGAGSFL